MKLYPSSAGKVLVGVLRFFAWWGGMFTILGGTGSVCPFCGQPGCMGGPASVGFLAGLFATFISLPKWLGRQFNTRNSRNLSSVKMYPLKFKPIYKERIWGGRKLQYYFNKDFPANINIGESWELADLPNDKSVIANGELAGKTIAEVIAQYPKEIMGDTNFSGQFPLLLKLLDAEEKLSVQVHPDRQTCERMGKGEPKTECWYIIAASPNAVIYKGLKEGVTKEQFAKSIADGTAADLLNKVPVKAGECHFIPAGTVHTIGENNMIAEIQTPSDTTYRVFDFNRTDAAGNPRQLHIEDALESINFDIDSSQLPVTTSGRLVDSKDFKIDKGEQPENSQIRISPGQMKVCLFIDGFGKIFETKTEKTDFAAGDCVLIPADYEGIMQFIGNTKYLSITI